MKLLLTFLILKNGLWLILEMRMCLVRSKLFKTSSFATWSVLFTREALSNRRFNSGRCKVRRTQLTKGRPCFHSRRLYRFYSNFVRDCVRLLKLGLSIEIWKLLMSWFQNLWTRLLLILGIVRIWKTKISLRCIIMWVHLRICLLRLIRNVSIVVRVMFGRWEFCFMKCWLEILLILGYRLKTFSGRFKGLDV